MTIAKAFNDIAVAQGGTASKSGTITGALDALTDALAGSDQPAPQTIEQGVRMLGEHIGGGGGGSYSIAVDSHVEHGTFEFYNTVWDESESNYIPTGDPVNILQGGAVAAALSKPDAGYSLADGTAELGTHSYDFGFNTTYTGADYWYFIMPNEECVFSGRFTED